MIKYYTFNYDNNEAQVCFKVDTEKFTEELTYATLDFFIWDYDKDNDPIDEVMKKYAIQAIRIATFNNRNLYGVKEAFNELDGFAKVDGTMGIELNMISHYEFDEDKFDINIVVE